jgi:hypothetical protein
MKACQLLAVAYATVVSGCAVYTDQGLYDVSASDGWRREASEATTFFYPPKARNADGFIAFTTEKKGELLMVVSFPGKSVRFEQKDLLIIPHDGDSSYQVSVDAARILVPSTSDFTIELPRVMIDDKLMPVIRARFIWSDRKYRSYRILQAP